MNFHKDFPARHAAKLEGAARGGVMLSVFVDRSSVEVLADGGVISITDRVFPDPSSRGVAVYAVGGKAKVRTLLAWKLKSVWR